MLYWRAIRTHWLTLAASLVVLAPLAYMNCAGQTTGFVHWDNVVNYRETLLYGWPFRHCQQEHASRCILLFGRTSDEFHLTFFSAVAAGADAVVGLTMLVSVSIFCERLMRRRTWLQFTLRDLFVLVTVAAVVLALLKSEGPCRLVPLCAYPWFISGPILFGVGCFCWDVMSVIAWSARRAAESQRSRANNPQPQSGTPLGSARPEKMIK
jgi:hypothetical protein